MDWIQFGVMLAAFASLIYMIHNDKKQRRIDMKAAAEQKEENAKRRAQERKEAAEHKAVQQKKYTETKVKEAIEHERRHARSEANLQAVVTEIGSLRSWTDEKFRSIENTLSEIKGLLNDRKSKNNA